MSNIKLFESKKIHSHWDTEAEKWYLAIVDIIAALTQSSNPQVYWRVLKKRLDAEGKETVTNCNALKIETTDGKEVNKNIVYFLSRAAIPVQQENAPLKRRLSGKN